MCVLGVDLQTTEVQNVISPHPSIEASWNTQWSDS
jgi:hypothetical protein